MNSVQGHMQLKRILRMAGKIIGIFFSSFLIAGFLIGFFYTKEIKQLFISEVNKNLSTKFQVEEFDFSVLRHFPFASFEMKNVLVDEVTKSNKKDTLLFSKRLSLLFNITDLFNKDVSIRKVLISDGSIN